MVGKATDGETLVNGPFLGTLVDGGDDLWLMVPCRSVDAKESVHSDLQS